MPGGVEQHRTLCLAFDSSHHPVDAVDGNRLNVHLIVHSFAYTPAHSLTACARNRQNIIDSLWRKFPNHRRDAAKNLGRCHCTGSIWMTSVISCSGDLFLGSVAGGSDRCDTRRRHSCAVQWVNTSGNHFYNCPAVSWDKCERRKVLHDMDVS